MYISLSVWLSLCIFICTYKYVVSDDECLPDICKRRITPNTVNPVLGMIGKSIVKSFRNETGFVFSGLKVTHKILQLFHLGSPSVKKEIRKLMELPDDEDCDNLFCLAFHLYLDTWEFDKPVVNYQSNLYFAPGNTLKVGSFPNCFTDAVPTEFSNVEATRKQLNEVHSKFNNESNFSHFDMHLNKKTDFYLLSALNVNRDVFDEYQEAIGFNEFTDIKGKKKVVRWLKFQGQAHLTILKERKTESKRELRLIRNQIKSVNFKLSMYYLKPVFKGTDTIQEKLNIMEILFGEFLNHVRDTSHPSLGTTKLSSTAVPLFEMETNTDLKVILEKQLEALFRPGNIENLYGKQDTLYDLKTSDYFSNDPRRPVRHECLDIRANETMDSPFLFLLIETYTWMPLKIGVYFG